MSDPLPPMTDVEDCWAALVYIRLATLCNVYGHFMVDMSVCIPEGHWTGEVKRSAGPWRRSMWYRGTVPGTWAARSSWYYCSGTIIWPIHSYGIAAAVYTYYVALG